MKHKDTSATHIHTQNFRCTVIDFPKGAFQLAFQLLDHNVPAANCSFMRVCVTLPAKYLKVCKYRM